MKALLDAIDVAVDKAEKSECYKPAIATALRLKADEMADKYPDDTTEGVIL